MTEQNRTKLKASQLTVIVAPSSYGASMPLWRTTPGLKTLAYAMGALCKHIILSYGIWEGTCFHNGALESHNCRAKRHIVKIPKHPVANDLSIASCL